MMNRWTLDEQKAHRKLWIEALRSGTYHQICGRLRLGNEFCCLGVACDVYGKQTSSSEWDGPRFYPERGNQLIYSGFALPDAVREWLGLATHDGRYGTGSDADYWCLIDDNDNDKKSFNEIADIIESEPEGLIDNT